MSDSPIVESVTPEYLRKCARDRYVNWGVQSSHYKVESMLEWRAADRIEQLERQCDREENADGA